MALPRSWSIKMAIGADLGACDKDTRSRSIQQPPPVEKFVEAERYSIWRFHQGAHRFLENPPAITETTDWLALMQHYGSPTRLLDWTASPYVAAFFAHEARPENENKNGKCALWAVNTDWLLRNTRAVLGDKIAIPNSAPMKPDWTREWLHLANRTLSKIHQASESQIGQDLPVVIGVYPSQLDERMAAQQGAFLCSLKGGSSLEETLVGMRCPNTDGTNALLKITMPRSKRPEFLWELSKMNINRASLFPGIEGLAKSIDIEVEAVADYRRRWADAVHDLVNPE